jgi:hypothetical protein
LDFAQVVQYPARQKPKQHRVHTTFSPPGRTGDASLPHPIELVFDDSGIAEGSDSSARSTGPEPAHHPDV